MSEKELLELAAKAAGLKFHAYVNSEIFGSGINIGDLDTPLWNPLTDDGDALRLAIQLDMQIWRSRGPSVCAMPPSGDFWKRLSEPLADDPYAATRRAIVRAAAEIGKTTP